MKKSFKIFFILFSFIINYQFLYAQVNLEWAREYYYNYSDNKAKCIAVDNDGNSAVTGTVLGSGIDIVTLRYNSGGICCGREYIQTQTSTILMTESVI
ncbi:MAG: hypothetical protein IPL53_04005 [Ignavibacteria bacterium]|nr:hypothetical protein [Ignavibacteria bacterium]